MSFCLNQNSKPNIYSICRKINKITMSEISIIMDGYATKNDLFPHEAHVMVIYTGGLIGMEKTKENVYEPVSNQLVKNLRIYPNFHDAEYAQKKFKANDGPLVLPNVMGFSRRVIYSIIEYEPLLNSSNMQMEDYTKIAKDIEKDYQNYDGFVILHGTDTLAYTASALSFMLENLGKTVIITGSQIPLFESRTDGIDNFLSSILIAGNHVIPEVCIYFGDVLLRGNRTVKISVASFNAFESPNYNYLAKSGINLEVHYRRIFRPNKIEQFKVHPQLDSNVGVLRLFPSITSTQVRAFCQPPIKGVVLHTFGAGNVPTNRDDLIEALREASAAGVIIVNCSQCLHGAVNVMYATGKMLEDCGVISGNDMTPEAALAKLSYLLARTELPIQDIKQMMLCNLRGELTPFKPPELQDYDLVEAVARTLQVPNNDVSHLGSTLFPAMINKAIIDCDLNKLSTLKQYGVDLSAVNCDGRTALHIACGVGSEDMVNYLLLEGASIHIRDRHNNTPLMEAISNDHHEIIKNLVKAGAYLISSPRNLGERLCAAAVRGITVRLESYKLAGGDLSQPDTTGRTALHLAALLGKEDVVEYLLENGGDIKKVDFSGLLPIDYAVKGGNPNIIKMLSE